MYRPVIQDATYQQLQTWYERHGTLKFSRGKPYPSMDYMLREMMQYLEAHT